MHHRTWGLSSMEYTLRKSISSPERPGWPAIRFMTPSAFPSMLHSCTLSSELVCLRSTSKLRAGGLRSGICPRGQQSSSITFTLQTLCLSKLQVASTICSSKLSSGSHRSSSRTPTTTAASSCPSSNTRTWSIASKSSPTFAIPSTATTRQVSRRARHPTRTTYTLCWRMLADALHWETEKATRHPPAAASSGRGDSAWVTGLGSGRAGMVRA
mmetsp:Transcript_25842/g.66648  ORF Transcript_25842/g.66648 Transcript_25842/m.66648 type:complete len:213 (-) Transcript_25842:175-813(-)